MTAAWRGSWRQSLHTRPLLWLGDARGLLPPLTPVARAPRHCPPELAAAGCRLSPVGVALALRHVHDVRRHGLLPHPGRERLGGRAPRGRVLGPDVDHLE